MTYWTNKAALVTGGSAGLGLVLAQRLASEGARVVIAARDRTRLEKAVELLRSQGHEAVGISADVTRQADVERLLEQSLDEFKRLDILVNCAGRSSRGRVRDTTPAEFTELWELNFLAAVRCTRAALPHLLTSRGHVVNIGSLAAKVALPVLGAYPASKFSLAAWSQQLRLDLAAEGLHVLLVCPGPIRRDDDGTRYDEAAANLPESARQPGGGARLKALDPDWLAGRILWACERRRAELVVPGKVRLLAAIGQLWPRLGDQILRKNS